MLESIFGDARAHGRAAFIPYLMAGDPDLATTQAMLAALSAEGAAAIELGIPYGDPLADGPAIAAAGQRALSGGTKIADVLALAARSRDAGGAPVILFTYFNPVYQYGIEAFARDAAAAGAAGAIVPDIALEESQELRTALTAQGIDLPLLVAPSTPRERAKRIAEASGGFVYVVSRLGVTGTGSAPDFTPLHAQVAMLREVTEKPLAVGFGVSRPEHVREVAAAADGFIVGSALIAAYAGKTGDDAARSLRAFTAPLVAASSRSSLQAK
jgi:tryptophan synthase alpha chain